MKTKKILAKDLQVGRWSQESDSNDVIIVNND